VIDLPRSTFYYRSTTANETLDDAALAELIGIIQDEMPGYGHRRVTHELRRRGHVVNHKRVARVMKAQGLGIKPRRRFVRTTDSKHDSPIFPNLYRIASGFCYLAGRIQPVVTTPGCRTDFRYSFKVSAGVFQPSVLRGLLFKVRATA
jgi:transposase InsO family protein